MNIYLNDTQELKMEVLTKRVGLEKNELGEMMFYRQYLLYIANPYKYTKSTLKQKKNRALEMKFKVEVSDQMIKKMETELRKARDRKGTGVFAILGKSEKDREMGCTMTEITPKMFSEELNSICLKRKECHRYLKKHFNELDKNGTIQQLSKSCSIPEKLKRDMEEFNLKTESLIKYCILSVNNLPPTVTEEKMMDIDYLIKLVDLKFHALGIFIEDAEKEIAKRDWLDKTIRELKPHDATAWNIRQALQGDTEWNGIVSLSELKSGYKEVLKNKTKGKSEL